MAFRTSDARLPRALLWLAVGTFATGTQNFVIAGLLPGIAAEFGVPVATVGQLVTVFALSCAIGSPVLATLTAGLDRRRLLTGALAGFAVANLLAAAAPSFWALAGARVLLALVTGLYVPTANALAGTLVAPERRGRALAVVNGGLTVALALGVPLGALAGSLFGWRTAFLAIAALGAVATAGVTIGVDRQATTGGDTIGGLRERLAVVRQPAVPGTLALTLVWATSAYAVFTYLAPFLASEVGLTGSGVSIALLVFGVGSVIGTALGGQAADKFGGDRVLAATVVALIAAYASLSVIAHALPPAAGLVPALVAIAIWGVAGWAFYPAQQARLLATAGPAPAGVAFSLNASFLFLGSSAGAAAGSIALRLGSNADLGWVAACLSLLNLGLLASIHRPAARQGERSALPAVLRRVTADGD